MWGSDWPVCELVCSYDDWRGTTETLLAALTDDERESIYSGVARSTYGI
jgi:L-fuconolactonase